VLVLLDLSKAFDCVDYHLFLQLVSSLDYHGSTREMVFTFLNGRSMVIDVDVLSFNRVFFVQNDFKLIPKRKKHVFRD
jgi:hypothetical protein